MKADLSWNVERISTAIAVLLRRRSGLSRSEIDKALTREAGGRYWDRGQLTSALIDGFSSEKRGWLGVEVWSVRTDDPRLSTGGVVGQAVNDASEVDLLIPEEDESRQMVPGLAVEEAELQRIRETQARASHMKSERSDVLARRGAEVRTTFAANHPIQMVSNKTIGIHAAQVEKYNDLT